jgi:hypothetical protein
MPLSFSKSKASDERIVAREYAQVAARSGQVTNPNSQALAKNATYVAPGSVQLAKGAELNTGIDLSGSKGAVTIQTGDGGEGLRSVESVTNTFADTLANITGQSNAALAAIAQQQAQARPTANPTTTPNPTSNGTAADEEQKTKPTTWLVLAGAAVAVWFLFRK